MAETKKPLTILLASPRGFCAGVERAIEIVERAIERYGPPVYVRHEIVHNRCVVETLEAKGAIFVEELDEVPNDRPVVFSAHGVQKAVPTEAQRRNLIYVDATCPPRLVVLNCPHGGACYIIPGFFADLGSYTPEMPQNC